MEHSDSGAGSPAEPEAPVVDGDGTAAPVGVAGPLPDRPSNGSEPAPSVAVPATPASPGSVPLTPTPDASFLPPSWREPAPTEREPVAGGSLEGFQPPPSGPSASVVPVWAPVGSSAQSPETEKAEPPDSRSRGWKWPVVALVAALVGGLVGGGIVVVSDHDGTSTTVKEISAGPALLNGTTNVQQVIAKVLPAVVSIDAKSSAPASGLSFGGDSNGTVQEDQGTGMIITSNGEVITNNHVIAGATTITVTLFGKTQSMPATLVDTDPTNDVALLQITGASNLPTVSYGNSDHVQVGDGVVAIGNALGLSAGSPTVTQGIISATGRTVQASDSSGNVTETLTNMFQTDAAINPGNSGGPLVDSSGKVIGMNTAVASGSDGTSEAQNIGFAIPANKIGQLLPDLRNKSIGTHAASGTTFLGVSLETLTSQLRSQYNFVPTQGAVVLQVESGSPADAAGLQQGDVITSFAGKPITSADQMASAIQNDKPGQTVKIGIYRGQTQKTVTATLGSNS